MKLIILLVVSCSYAAKLDRTYLPPPGAATSGGGAESLFVPLGPMSSIVSTSKLQDISPNQYYSTNGNQHVMPIPVSDDTQNIFTDDNTRDVTIPVSGLHNRTPILSSSINDNQRISKRPIPGDIRGDFQNRFQEDGLRNVISPVSRAGLRPNLENQYDETLGSTQNPTNNDPQNSFNLQEQNIEFNKPGNSVYNTQDFFNNPTFTTSVHKPERAQAAKDRAAEIVKYDTEIDGDSYHYRYETSNGISAEEKGIATKGVQAEGSYSYTGDDGKLYSVSYTADENGFQPHGDHLPTSPPIPEFILKSIEENAKVAASDVQDRPYEEAYDNLNTPEKGNIVKTQYSNDTTELNNDFSGRKPDSITSSSYQNKSRKPNLDQGSSSSDLKEAVNTFVSKDNDLTRQYNQNLNINIPSDTGYQYIRPPQSFDSQLSQTSSAPIVVPQNYNDKAYKNYTRPNNNISQNIMQPGIRPTNIPNLDSRETSNDFPSENDKNHNTEHQSDTKNYQYTTPKSFVPQNVNPNNLFSRYEPQEVSNIAKDQKYISNTDVSRKTEPNLDPYISQQNILSNVPQKPQNSNKFFDQRLTSESRNAESPSTPPKQFSTTMPEGYFYNPPSSQRIQFTDSNTPNIRPEAHITENTSPKPYSVNPPRENKYFTNPISRLTNPQISQNISPNSQTESMIQSQNMPLKDQTRQFSNEQSDSYPITTLMPHSNLVHDSVYQGHQNNRHPEKKQDSATSVQHSKQPIDSYHQSQHGNDEGYQYNRPEFQGIDYSSPMGNINNLPNSQNGNDNYNIDRTQDNKSKPTSISPKTFSDFNTDDNNNVPNDANDSPRQYSNNNDLRASTAKEDFSGPRQPPSYSPEEGYKY